MKTKFRIAKDVMTKHVVKARPWQLAHEAAKLLDSHGISGAPVVDEAGRLVGMITKSDLVRHLRRQGRPEERHEFFHADEAQLVADYLGPAESATVRELMTPFVITTDVSTPVRDLAGIMLTKHIHRILVTKQGKLEGVVSSMDLLKALHPTGGRG